MFYKLPDVSIYVWNLRLVETSHIYFIIPCIFIIFKSASQVFQALSSLHLYFTKEPERSHTF